MADYSKIEHRDYHKQMEIKQTLRLREITDELPFFVKTFFRGIESTTAPRTRIGYAYDIKCFFLFLQETNPLYKNCDLKQITLDDLSKLNALDIEEYLDYLSYYERDNRAFTNDERAKKRKLSALRVFFGYLYKRDMITENVVAKVDMPKIHNKAIIRMDVNEVADFLDNVEYGNKLTAHQQKYHEKSKVRDLALLSLMLSTGIRVSECVGLNINDVDFDNSRIKVTRKGGYEAFVFFGDEAEAALKNYLAEREKIDAKKDNEDALFLSSQRTRLGVRSVENLVKKYAQVTTPTKHITPHKLRSTYGTELYRETGDIYLVADVLGHKDVNTTKKHYADMDENKRRLARNAVQLRDSNNTENNNTTNSNITNDDK